MSLILSQIAYVCLFTFFPQACIEASHAAAYESVDRTLRTGAGNTLLPPCPEKAACFPVAPTRPSLGQADRDVDGRQGRGLIEQSTSVRKHRWNRRAAAQIQRYAEPSRGASIDSANSVHLSISCNLLAQRANSC